MFQDPAERFATIDAQFQELRAWLTEKIDWFQHQGPGSGTTRGPPADYAEYTRFKAETAAQRNLYDSLRQLQEEANTAMGIAPDAWHEVDTNWQKVEAQVSVHCEVVYAGPETDYVLQLRHWQWLLDTSLPGAFGQVGEWLNQAEGLVYSDDVPAQLNEEAAALLNQKIEDHKVNVKVMQKKPHRLQCTFPALKAFFGDLGSVRRQFSTARADERLVEQVPREQLENMARRLKEIGPKSDIRAVKLKYLEHKVRMFKARRADLHRKSHGIFLSVASWPS